MSDEPKNQSPQNPGKSQNPNPSPTPEPAPPKEIYTPKEMDLLMNSRRPDSGRIITGNDSKQKD